MSQHLKLNLGCGGAVLKGWVNIDRQFSIDVQGRADARCGISRSDLLKHDLRDPLPFEDDSAVMAVAHHSIDLLAASEVDALLREVKRVLAPGGVLRVSLFDILKAENARLDGNYEWFRQRGADFVDGIDGAMRWMVTQNGARKWVTTPELLGGLLEVAGFTWTECGQYETTAGESILDLDSRPEESFYLEATA